MSGKWEEIADMSKYCTPLNQTERVKQIKALANRYNLTVGFSFNQGIFV
jgi:hypothetical protein